MYESKVRPHMIKILDERNESKLQEGFRNRNFENHGNMRSSLKEQGMLQETPRLGGAD